MISFVIDFKVTSEYGLNKLYAGTHWTVRKRQADFIHAMVQSTLYALKVPRTPFKTPVRVSISYNSKLDIDNHGYISKLIIDGLKGWVIQDDTKKYVKELEQKFWKGKGILVEIIEE